MGMSKEQSVVVFNQMLERLRSELRNNEIMVCNWAKQLIASSDSSYMQGFQDGLGCGDAIAEALKLFSKEIAKLKAKKHEDGSPQWDGNYE